MATIRPFAYNIGSVLSGTTQYGTLAVGVDRNLPYSGNYGGLRWWMGPDEDLGYCIGTSVTDNDQPTEPGIIPPFGNVEFWRTESFSDSEFISLSNNISGQNFTSSAEAVTWLNDNGYWTSYGGISPSPTPTPTQTSTNTPTPSVTPTSTLTPTPSSTPGDDSLMNPIITENDEYIQVGNDEYLMFVDPSGPVVTPSSTPEVTTTPTPSITPTITLTSSEVPVTPTPTPSITPTIVPPSSGFTVTIQEVGSDVIWSGSGSFDISNLSLENTDQLAAGFAAASAIWAVGPNFPVNVELYGGFAFDTYPTSFGSGGSPASNGTGDLFGILFGGSGRSLVVPENYISGTQLSGSTTYANTTISGLNLVVGTYTYSWGSNPGETLTLIIG